MDKQKEVQTIASKTSMAIPESQKPQICGIKRWILYALTAMSCMGSGQYIYATTFSQVGLVATGVVGPAPLILILILKLILAI